MPNESQATSLLSAAISLHKAGDHAAAQEQYRRVLAQTPDHAEALYLSGALDYQLGDFGEAATKLERSLAARPGHLPARGDDALLLGRPRPGTEIHRYWVRNLGAGGGDVQGERARTGGREGYPAGFYAGRNRLPVPDACTSSRAAERAGVRGGDGALHRSPP